MKKLFTFYFSLFTFYSYSQTVFEHYVDGQVYVKLSADAPKQVYQVNPNDVPVSVLGEIGKVLTKYGVTKITRTFHQASDDKDLPKILRVRFSQIGSVQELIDELKNTTGIEYAEKVPLAKIHAIPNDPNFPAHLNQINAQNAWNVFNGNSNITVAIVDNAVMWTHEDLVANTYTNTNEIPNNNIDDDNNGYIDDVNGYDVADLDNNTVPTNSLMNHGTYCAGIAGATTDNSVGVASIGWNIKIIPVKCQYDGGSTSIVSTGYEGIIYAAKAGARIISCSWGDAGYSVSEQLAVNYAWNKGCIIISSAGNLSSTTPNYPCAYNHVYCVAAVDAADVKLGMSNYGTWVDITAPGNNIMSTSSYTGTPDYLISSGTSAAAPLVAGLAGLMLSKTSYMTQNDVLNCISNTAVNIYTLSGNSTYNNQLGAGRVEAYQAMLCAASFSNAMPVANFYAYPLVSCPNASVSFYDSSLYVPTSWNWTFQGGTPATSTLQNPIVQWTTAGTYSVSLTVTNANGTDTKTKLSYITITNPIALPFAEGFENPQFLPANWTSKNINNDNVFWERKTNLGAYGTSTACAMFDNYTSDAAGERDEMISPKFNFANVSSARLRFDVAYARYSAFNTDTLEVKVSTNCGATWTSIYLKGGTNLATAPDVTSQFVPTNSQWRKDSIDISALTAGQGNVMFSFINRGHFGQVIYLDNINLVFPTPTVNFSLPASTMCVNVSVPPLLAIVNLTNTSIGATSYTWNFGNSAMPVTSNSVNPSVGYTSVGIHTITLVGANGTATASVTKTISLVAPPSLMASASASAVCSGKTVTLTAMGANSYTWSTGVFGNTGVTGSMVVVTVMTPIFYSVIGSNGVCSAYANGIVSVYIPPTTVLSTTNSPCNALCTGVVNATTYTGATPYTYSVSGTNCTTLPCTNLCDGTYTLYTQTSQGCTSSNTFSIACITVTVTDTTSIHSFNLEHDVQIYPNPAQDELHIDFAGVFNYILYNSLGQIISSERNISTKTVIDLSRFAQGIYFVEVKSGAGVLRKKVVLE